MKQTVCRICKKPVEGIKPIAGHHPTHNECFAKQMQAIGYKQIRTDSFKNVHSQ